MPEIDHRHLSDHLARGDAAALFLIYGEEMLVKTALQTLLNALVPSEQRALAYDPLEGSEENVPFALERLQTYSLLAGAPKIVALLDAPFFHTRANAARFLDTARRRALKPDWDGAARSLLGYLALQGMTLDDADAPPDEGPLAVAARETWFHQVVAHCRDRRLEPPPEGAHALLLQSAAEKGFPAGHRLIITAEAVDRRLALFKTVKRLGLVVDCTVPAGDRKADRRVQNEILTAQLNRILQARGKTIEPRARQHLLELTGFDLRMFSQNLEKVIDYAGSRRRLTAADVRQVLIRTRKDPVYALTGALAARDRAAALVTLQALLHDGMHPLQVLAAMVNQVRRLLVARDFMDTRPGIWRPGLSYAAFQSGVLPAIAQYDDTPTPPPTGGRKAGSAPAPRTDLLLAGGSRSPYPVYLLLGHAEGFSTARLIGALERLLEADRRLKSSSAQPRLILEDCLTYMCT